MACEELHGDTVSTGVISAFGCVFDRFFFTRELNIYHIYPSHVVSFHWLADEPSW